MSLFRDKNFLRILIILFISVCINAYALDDAKYEEGKVYRHKLSNGLVVLTIERHIAPLIFHQLTYKVGSRNEKLGITGISHVVEHMMFKGTPKYGKGQASKIISKNSGVFNAFTMNDMTSYYEYMPANKIEVAMDIESDRMLNSKFDTAEFKSEIEVIKQERRMRSESQVNGVMRETLNQIAFSSSPNRDPVIGWPGDLNHMSRDDAYNYYKTFYTPNNAFLVLVGDFKTDEILQLAEKYYGKIPAGPNVPEVWSVEGPQKVRKSFTIYHSDITSPSIGFAFHIPTYEDADVPALRIAATIFCEKSRDARLYKRMVEKDQIAQMAAGGFGMSKDPDLFQISVSAKPDSSLDKIEMILWEETNKMQNEPVTDHELQKAKNRYKFSQITNYTKNADIGSRLSRYEAYFGWDFYNEYDKRIYAVTKEDIMRVMKKYFNPEQVTVSYAYPKEGSKKAIKKGTDEENDENNDLENLLNETGDKFYYMPPEAALDLTAKYIRSDEEEFIKPNPIAPMIKELKLDNGITVYAIENHLVPSLTVVGTFETGLIPEAIANQKPGICDYLAAVMNRGTEKMNYNELTERMAFVPFSFAVSGSYKGFYFQGYSLLENADEMMKTGFDIVTKPALNNDEIEKLRPRLIIQAKNRFKRTGIKAFYEMFNTIFDDHPITKINSTVASIKSITHDDFVELHKKYLRPDRLTLLMVGDMKPEEMREFANKYFGKWKVEVPLTGLITAPPVRELKEKVIKVFPEKDYTECTINIGFAPYNKIEPAEEEATQVLNYILAGSALTSRMGIELRDKQGLIYGIKSDFWVKSDSIGYWKFNTKTAPKNTEKVITGIFSEIKKLQEDGITDAEFNTAKNRLLGLLPFYVETPDDVAQKVFNLITDKQPFDFYDKKADRIKAVTKEDVIRLAKKYFTPDKYVIVVDGPIEEHSLDHLLDKL